MQVPLLIWVYQLSEEAKFRHIHQHQTETMVYQLSTRYQLNLGHSLPKQTALNCSLFRTLVSTECRAVVTHIIPASAFCHRIPILFELVSVSTSTILSKRLIEEKPEGDIYERGKGLMASFA